MTTTQKKIIFSLLLGISISVFLLLSQCKSPAPPTDASIATQTDSTAIDTSKAAAVPIDTMAKKVSHVPLTLVISNLRSDTATIVVGLYGTKNKFPDPKDQLKVYYFKPNGKELTATITDLTFGEYALAIYQDVNGNGKIDKNFVGIPTEPYAFSNNYHPKVKAPNFNDCKFSYDATSPAIAMTMIK